MEWKLLEAALASSAQQQAVQRTLLCFRQVGQGYLLASSNATQHGGIFSHCCLLHSLLLFSLSLWHSQSQVSMLTLQLHSQ